MLISTEERNKAKQSYQESLQNVATARQQAAVSHSLSRPSISSPPLQMGFALCQLIPVGKVHIHEKQECYSPMSLAQHIKDSAVIGSLTLRSAPHFLKTRLIFLHINTVSHKRANHGCQSAAPACRWPFNIYICHMMCLGKKNTQRGIAALETCPPLIKRFSSLLGNNNSYFSAQKPTSC